MALSILNCQKQFYEKLYDNVNEINDDTPIEKLLVKTKLNFQMQRLKQLKGI